MDRTLLDELQRLVMSEQPSPADAIVWLQGNRYDRGPKVLALYRAGHAPAIVITGNDVRHDEAAAQDGVHVMVGDLRQWLLARDVPDAAIVVDVAAMHTHDQATHVIAIARDRRWRTLLLVASPHHQARAFLTFLRAAHIAKWDGRVVNQPAGLAWDAIPSGRTQTSAACFAEEAAKIDRYCDHLASLEAGITALRTAACGRRREAIP